MILFPKKPKVIEKKGNLAKFEIESLYTGYGTTIGNSLRRVLLSSLPGTAITQIKIKGAQHEFSTISGVLEDVITIIMNLKQTRFKLYSEEPQKAVLKAKGEKKITAGDFKCPAQLELINKDCHIAELTSKNAGLEIEVQVERGIGYEQAEQRKEQKKKEIGVIQIDAIFSPVRQVGLRVENMRVGDRTDFDRLFLEIETDGSITPEQALASASKILIDHFVLIKNSFEEEKKQGRAGIIKEKKEKEEEKVKEAEEKSEEEKEEKQGEKDEKKQEKPAKKPEKQEKKKENKSKKSASSKKKK